MVDDAGAVEEFTVDELAARAKMTVRNVRAYAGRGLIAPPRLQGRTGYYNREHLQRLQLIRQFLDRGYTLAAVEEAMLRTPERSASHALDLMALLDLPESEDGSELMSRESLAALAGVERNDKLIAAMADFGLVEEVDDTTVRLIQPVVVRAGAAAVQLGLAPATVIALFPLLKSRLREIADAFVGDVVNELVGPFLDAGMPEEEWPRIIGIIESLLPIASQVTLGIFRGELRDSIDVAVGEQIDHIGGSAKP